MPSYSTSSSSRPSMAAFEHIAAPGPSSSSPLSGLPSICASDTISAVPLFSPPFPRVPTDGRLSVPPSNALGAERDGEGGMRDAAAPAVEAHFIRLARGRWVSRKVDDWPNACSWLLTHLISSIFTPFLATKQCLIPRSRLSTIIGIPSPPPAFPFPFPLAPVQVRGASSESIVSSTPPCIVFCSGMTRYCAEWV